MISTSVRELVPRRQVPESVLLLALCVAGVAARAGAAPSDGTVPLPALPASGFAQQAYGVNRAEGELWGGGPGYKVHFAPGGIEFTPALGRAAPCNVPLSLQASSIRRGDVLLWSAASSAAALPDVLGTAVHHSNTVRYTLQPGLTERFDVGRDGLEQSFVLDAPPPGAGDLVVRLDVRSELVPLADESGLRFESAGFGGVRYGSVTGVDADGRQAAGQVRVLSASELAPGAAGAIELSLPAEFVASARYPLVLDPVISPMYPLYVDPSLEEAWPDIAYEQSGSHYLAVWTQIYSLSDFDIRGQMLDATGALVPSGFYFLEVASNTVASMPAVASLQAYNQFFVAWEQRAFFGGQADIHGISISNVFGQNAEITVQATGLDEVHPDVGGHSSDQPGVVSVVWAAGGNILHRNVFLPFSGNPLLADNVETVDVQGCSEPSISSSGGDSMRFLIAYKVLYFNQFGGFDNEIWGAVIDVVGNVFSVGQLVGIIGADERSPAVDGDGQQFVLGFTRAPDLASEIAGVFSQRFLVSPSGIPALAGPEVTLNNDGQYDNAEPSVAFAGDGYLVSWAQQAQGADYDIAIVGLDLLSGSISDPVQYADLALTGAHNPKLAARFSSDHDGGDGAVCVWYAEDNFSPDTEVSAATVDPSFGTVVDLGGGTPGGGQAAASGATLGSQDFTHTYQGLYPLNSVLLIIGFFPLGAPICGGELAMDPDTAFFLSFLTDPDDAVSLITPIPADPILAGLTIYEQWVETDVLTSPCGKKIQLSNGLAVTIE